LILSWLLAGLVFAALALGWLFYWMFYRLTAVAPPMADAVAWLAAYSTNRYRSLERLLSDVDSDWLETVWRSSGGPQPSKARENLRANRRRVFRMLLATIRRDFARLERIGKAILLESSVDRPDLAGLLVKARIVFGFALLGAEARLLLHWAGVRPAAGGLLEPLSQLGNALRSAQLSVRAGD
jgi:hypothetical protein